MSIAPQESQQRQPNLQQKINGLNLNNKLRLRMNHKQFKKLKLPNMHPKQPYNENDYNQVKSFSKNLKMTQKLSDELEQISDSSSSSQKYDQTNNKIEEKYIISSNQGQNLNQNQQKQQNIYQRKKQKKSVQNNLLTNSKRVISFKSEKNNINIQQQPLQKQAIQKQSPQTQTQTQEQTSAQFDQLFNKAKQKIRAFLESIPFQIFITLITIGSLFMEDLRTIFVEKSNDQYVDMVDISFLAIFSIQIMLSMTTQNYIGSFFFYLDCISTASILMDVSIFTNIIYNSGGNSQQLSILVAQSKASRAAARAVRIMKIFRLARVVKLYKSALKAKQMNEKLQQQRIKLRQKAKQRMKNQQNQNNYQNNLQDGTNSQYNSKIISKHSLLNSISQKSERDSKKLKLVTLRTSNQKLNKNQFYVSNTKNKTKNQNNFGNGKKSLMHPIQYIREQPEDIEKQDQTQLEINKDSEEAIDLVNEKQQQRTSTPKIEINTKQSNISKILSDTTIKKIIIVILIIMFSVTIFDITNYYPEDTAWDFMVLYVANLLQSPSISVDFINNMIQKKVTSFAQLGIYADIIAIQTPFDQLYYLHAKDYSQMRIDEVGLYQAAVNVTKVLQLRPHLTVSGFNSTSTQISQSGFITVVFDYNSYNVVDSWFSMSRIVFICMTILYLLQSFNYSITNLIVTPIQKMLQIVVSPQAKKNAKDVDKQNNQNDQLQGENVEFRQARYEANIVQKAIIKIRSLMSTIFGKIGMDLIYHQLLVKDSSVQDYLKTSKKRFCIYGICRIQNFTQIAQILSEDIFIFTNQIAQIVHSSVYRYGGHGVKNLKDGFLITFSLPQENQEQIIKDAFKKAQTKQTSNTYLNILSDYAIYSFTKILVRLHKQPKILQYKKDQRLLQKFGNSFQIQMNFALSLGQSIQGIIGSQIKIDPIYLGGKISDVSKISKISTKYSNIIILQRQIYKCLTHSLQRHCRIMDFVKLNKYDQGNTQLYIIDLDLQYISPSRNRADKQKAKEEHSDIHLKRQINMEFLKDNIEMDNYNAQVFINGKKQLREVLKKVLSEETKQKYAMAFASYANKEWLQTKQHLQQILRMTKQDILTNRLYEYIKKHDFKSENLQKYKPVQQI